MTPVDAKPSTLPPPGSGLVRQMPFRLVLQAKLHLIVWAAGGKKKAARKLGMYYRSFSRWASGQTTFPTFKGLQKIDDAYAVAFEKRCVYEQRLFRQRLKRKAKQTPPDMHISVDAV